ncbi:CsiV family protein [Paraferrimonas haliotis]|uniref:CsiV family protein n=1 Tax=Paraferrimonas haliotis TaxID=2013866 RepID=UPI000BA9C57A|nr:CsiV family protein [Paraferrimonas haliotis]
MTQSLYKSLFIALPLMFSNQVFAQDPTWFEVEIFIFKQQSDTQEDWSDAIPDMSLRNSQDLITDLVINSQSNLVDALEPCTAADWATDPDRCSSDWNQPFAKPDMPPVLPVTIVAPESDDLNADSTASVITEASPDTIEPSNETPQDSITVVSDNMPNEADQAPLVLRDSELQFTDMIGSIEQNMGVEGLLHMGWRQGVYPRFQARPFSLIAGNDLSQEWTKEGLPRQDVESTEQLVPQFEFLSSHLDSDDKDPLWELQGSLNIYLDHYLFIETNLVLREPGIRQAIMTNSELVNADKSPLTDAMNKTSEESNVTLEPIPQAFLYNIPFKQNKRVRSREIHYMDHPKLGVIIQIRRMAQPGEVNPAD